MDRKVSLRGRTYTVQNQSGVFSHDRVDKGTAVLLDKVPVPNLTAGQIAVDVGCGWGPISLALAAEAPEATIWAVDVNERARELTHANLERHGFTAATYSPESAFAELNGRQIDLIWSNPPVRIGKEAMHELLVSWLSVLSPEGVAYLVVQKNLGADSLQKWLIEKSFSCEKIGSAKGFRVFAARRLVAGNSDEIGFSNE